MYCYFQILFIKNTGIITCDNTVLKYRKNISENVIWLNANMNTKGIKNGKTNSLAQSQDHRSTEKADK